MDETAQNGRLRSQTRHSEIKYMSTVGRSKIINVDTVFRKNSARQIQTGLTPHPVGSVAYWAETEAIVVRPCHEERAHVFADSSERKYAPVVGDRELRRRVEAEVPART